MRPDQSCRHRLHRIESAIVQACNLPTDTAKVAVIKRGFQSIQNSAAGFLSRGIGNVDPRMSVLDLGRVVPHVIAANQAFTSVEAKLPIVPIACERTVVRQMAFGKRIALVRTAIVDRIYRTMEAEHRDLLWRMLDYDGPALKLIEGNGFYPGHDGPPELNKLDLGILFTR